MKTKGNFKFALLALMLMLACVRAQSSVNVVAVDFARSIAGTKSMSGFLHGIEPDKPPDDLILPLKPKQWRASYSDKAVYERIRKSGARIQLVLSDFWGYTGLSTDRPLPVRDFSQFEKFVASLARTYGAKDVVWDVWNEPEDPKLPYWKGTFREFCATYLRAYRVLRRELGSEAIIGGPSFSRYDKTLMKEFLDFCKSNGCEVNFLSWHELDESDITGIPKRLDEARALFVNNPAYAGLKIREIQINEIIGGDAQYSPGVILGYFYHLEKGKADGAAKACWENAAGKSNCDEAALDGLIRQSDLQPTAAWHAYKIYADGAESRVESSTTNPLVAALASRESDAPNKAQILIGYFKEKQNAPAQINVSLDLKNLRTLPFLRQNNSARVKIRKLRNTGDRAVQNLEFVSEKDFRLSNNFLQLTLNKVALDEAYLITVSNSAVK